MQLSTRATSVTVTITFASREAKLDIVDNGVGFNVPSFGDFAPGAKLGLLGMLEHAELLGGRLEIESRPGKGTRVMASIPLKGYLNDTSDNPGY